MSRSSWKMPHVNLSLSRQCAIRKRKKFVSPVVHERSTTLTPEMIDSTLLVHNGYRFVPVNVTENHVGFKVGEFSFTKKRVKHKKKKL